MVERHVMGAQNAVSVALTQASYAVDSWFGDVRFGPDVSL